MRSATWRTLYKKQQGGIRDKSISDTINFIKIDCSLPKASLVDHCLQWQFKLSSLLNTIARTKLARCTTCSATNSRCASSRSTSTRSP